MKKYHFIETSGRRQAPAVSANDLPEYSLSHSTQSWKQGMDEWQTTCSISELLKSKIYGTVLFY